MQGDEVTICIPAWNASAFIRRALGSAIAQTHRAVRIIVSVDRGDDDTAAVCRSYDDPRIEVIEQTGRMGWVGNVNALLDRVATPYFCFVFHDDSIDPRYVARLLAVLNARDDAVAASSAIRYSGDKRFVQRLRPVEGSLFERLRAILAVPDSFHTLKALHRSGPVRAGMRLEGNPYSGFQADVPFMMKMVTHGAYLHVDDVLYEKLVWDGSVTGGWRGWSGDRFVAALATAIAARIRVVQACALGTAEKCALIELALAARAPKLTEAENFVEHLQRYPGMLAAAVIACLSGEQVAATDLVSDPETEELRKAALAGRARIIARQALVRGLADLGRTSAAASVQYDRDNAEGHALLARSLLAFEPASRTQLARLARLHAETAMRLAPGVAGHRDLLEATRARLWMSGPWRFALMPFKPLLLRMWRWRIRQTKELSRAGKRRD